jgi:ABC-type uncharacterized transport system substrate-binding protein
MCNRRIQTSLRYISFITLIFVTSLLQAHPHVWVDLRVRPLMNDQQQLVALQQSWRFDPFYSLILIEELERGGPIAELEQRFDQLALEVATNLARFDFFSRVSSQGLRQSFAEVTEYNLMRVGQRVEFSFVLPLKTPLDSRTTLNYQVYDPSYYIEILHTPENGLDRSSLSQTCQVELQAPNPSSDLIEKALALDADQTPDDPELGVHFAERVLIRCQPEATNKD